MNLLSILGLFTVVAAVMFLFLTIITFIQIKLDENISFWEFVIYVLLVFISLFVFFGGLGTWYCGDFLLFF